MNNKFESTWPEGCVL